MTTTEGSRSISSYIACLMASRNVTCVGALASPLPLPPFADAFVAGAVEVFAMGYLRPFFATLLAAGFLVDLAAGLADDFDAGFAAGLAATLAATFASGLRPAALPFLPGFDFPAPFVDFAAIFAAGLITCSVTTSSGVSGESFSSTPLRSSLCAVSPK